MRRSRPPKGLSSHWGGKKTGESFLNSKSRPKLLTGYISRGWGVAAETGSEYCDEGKEEEHIEAKGEGKGMKEEWRSIGKERNDGKEEYW
jgi:hypothetical protein